MLRYPYIYFVKQATRCPDEEKMGWDGSLETNARERIVLSMFTTIKVGGTHSGLPNMVKRPECQDWVGLRGKPREAVLLPRHASESASAASSDSNHGIQGSAGPTTNRLSASPRQSRTFAVLPIAQEITSLIVFFAYLQYKQQRDSNEIYL